MSTASAYLTVRGINVDVVYKDIKNLHIGVYPPMGRVRVAAPQRLDDDQVRLAVIQRLPWIKRQRQQLQDAERQSAARDGHRRVALRLGRAPSAEGHRAARPRARRGRRRPAPALRAGRHRHRRSGVSCSSAGSASSCGTPIPALIAKWEPIIDRTVPRWSIRRMKTKWGSCNRETRPHLVQRRTRQEAPRLPGVHRRPRDDPPSRTQSRRALHRTHGQASAGLA